ncbi:hypothetical protein LguiA_019487 [Lonicera macranthoides]
MDNQDQEQTNNSNRSRSRSRSRSRREVKFPRRLGGLMKKARELSILCDCQVAVILFSSNGALHQFSSSSMNEIISRYLRCVGYNAERAPESTSASGLLTATEERELAEGTQEPKTEDFMMEQLLKIQSTQGRLADKEDDDMDLEQVQRLLVILNEGLVAMQERKEKLIKEQLEQSRLQEQQQYTMLEMEASCQEVMNLKDFFPPAEQPSVPYYIEWDDPMQAQNFLSDNNNNNNSGALSSDNVYNFEADNGDSDTTLQLGLPYHVDRKRKEPEKETKYQQTPDSNEPVISSSWWSINSNK